MSFPLRNAIRPRGGSETRACPSQKSCREWWQEKYRFDGREKLYSAVEGLHDGLDSKQTTKRIVTFGNVLMTCGRVKKSDEHIKFLDLYVKKPRE